MTVSIEKLKCLQCEKDTLQGVVQGKGSQENGEWIRIQVCPECKVVYSSYNVHHLVIKQNYKQECR